MQQYDIIFARDGALTRLRVSTQQLESASNDNTRFFAWLRYYTTKSEIL